MDVRPHCKNPHHPVGMSRDSMVCSRESVEHFVFYCKTCLEVKHLQSIQVKTRARYREEVRRKLASEGRLPTGPPPIVRRTRMDESMMDRERVFGGKK